MSETRSYADAVKITVDWWIQKSFNETDTHDMGPDSDSAMFAQQLGNELAQMQRDKVQPEQIEMFREALTTGLMAIEDKPPFSRICDVDYHPNHILSEAATAAGVDLSVFPWKTFTRIKSDNTVEGRNGYGSEWFTL